MLPNPGIVLDTNVVLDWLVFRNPQCQPLAQAIENGRLRWLATHPMRDELRHVLARRPFGRWIPDEQRVWSTWEQLVTTLSDPPLPTGGASRLRCTDPDDQKFVDLALTSARWLISRDRAILKLAKRASLFGVQVLTPEHWSMA